MSSGANVAAGPRPQAASAPRSWAAPRRPHPWSAPCRAWPGPAPCLARRFGNDCQWARVVLAMQVVSLHSRIGSPRSADHSSAVFVVAKVAAVAGVVAYNWWVVVPFVPGLMPSVNGFFSDLEVAGRPHASQMSDADMAAGLLMVVALLLRGPGASHGVRREWKWMVAFAVAGAVGGRFPYACSEGLSATCRSLEWHLRLPPHHYIHVVSGIAEFGTLTTAAVIAMLRTRNDGTGVSHIYADIVKVLAVSYPFLGLVYLTDRLGTFVEPIFFIAFSVMVLAEVFEPTGRAVTPTSWSARVLARADGGHDMAQAPPAAGRAPAAGTGSGLDGARKSSER